MVSRPPRALRARQIKTIPKTATTRKAPMPMLTRGKKLLRSVQNKLVAQSEVFVRVTFGVFIGSLLVLLILLYADVPIIGS
jgi:hypothetical protein